MLQNNKTPKQSLQNMQRKLPNDSSGSIDGIGCVFMLVLAVAELVYITKFYTPTTVL